MTDGREHGIVAVAKPAPEEVAAEVAIGFQVADDGLDGGAAPELAFDGPMDAALLA